MKLSKKIQVVSQHNCQAPTVYVESNSFCGVTQDGFIVVEANSLNEKVKLSYPGIPTVEVAFSALSEKYQVTDTEIKAVEKPTLQTQEVMKKTVRFLDENGNPLVGVHVMPENGTSTITNANGYATVEVANQDTFVEITHVSGESVHVPFYELQDSVTLQANQLPEVVVTAKNSKKKWRWLLGIATVVGFAMLPSGKPTRVKL